MPRQDSSIGINLLKYFNTPQELADVGAATKKDPSLLELPALTSNDKIVTALNDVSEFFGMFFGDQNVVQMANMRRQQYDQERESKVIQRLLPIVGQAEQDRQAAVAKARQDEAEAKRQQQRTLAREHLFSSYRRTDPETGKDRPLNLKELDMAVDAMEYGSGNPAGAINGPSPFDDFLGSLHKIDPVAEAEKRMAHQLEMQSNAIGAAAERTGAAIGAGFSKQQKSFDEAERVRKQERDLDKKEKIEAENRKREAEKEWSLEDIQKETARMQKEIEGESNIVAGPDGKPMLNTNKKTMKQKIKEFKAANPKINLSSKAIEHLNQFTYR